MSSFKRVFDSLKFLFYLILIISVTIPIRYGSTNTTYLKIRLFHSLLTLKHFILSDQNRPTLSPDYRAFEEIISLRPLGNLKKPKDQNDFIKEMRLSFGMGNLIPKPSSCQVKEQIFYHNNHSVQTFWIDNHQNDQSTTSNRLLIYLHGGGYVLGDVKGYSGFECYLSNLFNTTVLHIEYRLCPEHSIQEAVQDTTTLYQSILHQNLLSSSKILFMGDSAGGGLTLLTIQSIIKQELPIPRGIIVLSPWTDLSASGESYIRNRQSDVLFRHVGNDDSMVKLILGPNSSQLFSNDSIFSPLFGSFKDFPPMFINVGTAEILEDDSRSVMIKAKQENVDVTFEEGKDLMHVYPIFHRYYPEAENTLNNIKSWIESIFDKESSG